ncbi:MAG: GNAT family N-acetyltransferase [Oscillospiraceae bacterium]|jgi:predicted acetyltransferase|nr:GNAT family N-acetyltransferase [Oscillospiraceae bacterium]
MFSLAKDGMRPQLEELWQIAFNDTPGNIRFFFENRYNPNNCAVYTDKMGNVAAALHMLPASITEDSEILPVQYIYAAATLPQYQGKGVMTSLLVYAERIARARGQEYSILVPAEKPLFKFYENRGYKTCFGYRRVNMTRHELNTIIKTNSGKAAASQVYYNTLQSEHLFNLRRDVLTEHEGYINWDAPAVRYACDYHRLQRGSVITATNGYEAGYALCFDHGETLEISEYISHAEFSVHLIKALLELTDAQYFKIRMPAMDTIFFKYGELVPYGMLKDTTDSNPINLISLSGLHTPYLGLALE